MTCPKLVSLARVNPRFLVTLTRDLDSAATMSRRTRASTVDDGDSLENNVGVNAKEKRVKVKQEKAKKGKTRRVESDEEPEPSQVDGQEENGADQERDDLEGNEVEEHDGTPKGRKRARINSVGASAPSSPNQSENQRIKTLPRDTDG